MTAVDILAPSARLTGPASPARDPRWLTVGLAAAAMTGTALGFSGVGDAPDPHASASEIAAWFTIRRSEVLHAAAFGHIGALAVVGLAAALAADARRRVPAAAARSRVLLAGGVVTASYLVGAQIAWSSNASAIAASSPQSAKAVFVVTIASVPVLAIGVALMAGSAVLHAPWPLARGIWRIVSAAIASMSSVGVVAIADRGFFSPDVQQQVIANSLLAWLLLTALAAALPVRRTALSSTTPSHPEAPT